jgi:hypothetical protein
MKFVLLCIVLFSTPVLFAKVKGDFLSPVERSEVIRSIDDVCGDTWCEGDYNFKFNNFSCNFREKNCDLTFYFIKSDDQDVEIYSPLQVCHFDNITSIKHIRNNRFSLNENFYDKITECIGMLEEKVIF